MTPLQKKHLLKAKQLRLICALQPLTAPQMYRAIGVTRQHWNGAWWGRNAGLSKKRLDTLVNFLKENKKFN